MIWPVSITSDLSALPRLRFHELRHTFVSIWVRNGGDPYELMKALEYSDFKGSYAMLDLFFTAVIDNRKKF